MLKMALKNEKDFLKKNHGNVKIEDIQVEINLK